MSTTPDQPAEWGHVQRGAFRFLFAYLALYFFPLPSGLADPEWISKIFDKPWHELVSWVGEHLLHLKITAFSNGSGDTTYNYIQILSMAVLALVAALVWSALDRQRRDYRALHGWARVWLRYALAISMLDYGLRKVIPSLQFGTPGVDQLLETYGESSPRSLLWIFMGFSTAYTFFAGAGEVLGALLLFFRRTTTLGAMVVTGVMSNVVMLNLCYDVPVKLGSLHLLFLALFLLAPDIGRLANLLVLNRPTEPAALGPELSGLWMRRVAAGLKVLVIGGVLSIQLHDRWLEYEQSGTSDVHPFGWYAVTSFREEGQEVPALATDGHRWKIFRLWQGGLGFIGFDGSRRRFKVDEDPRQEPMTLLPAEWNESGELVPLAGAVPAGRLRLDLAADGKAGLEGIFDGRTIKVSLAPLNPADFPLMNRGFHWINE